MAVWRYSHDLAIITVMRRAFYRYAIWILMLALVTSGATWSQCTASSLAKIAPVVVSKLAPAPADAGEHAHHRHHAGMPQAEHTQMAHPDTGSGGTSQEGHGCQKCCAMCGITTILGNFPILQIAAVEHPIQFSSFRDGATSRVSRLDPEIPKALT